jgi:hypothetical protein
MFLLRETGHPCSNANSNASIENIYTRPPFWIAFQIDFFKINYIFLFLNRFNILILKIFFKKIYIFNVFLNKKYFKK